MSWPPKTVPVFVDQWSRSEFTLCPRSSRKMITQRMAAESPTCRLSVPQRKFGFEEITKLSLKSWLFADIGGEVTHCNAAFLKPPSVSRLVAWQIDPGHLTSFLEERGS